MAYSVLMYIYRKEGTSFEHFQEYYESKHVPVIQRLSGNLFPSSHFRHYVGHVPQREAVEAKDAASKVATGDARVQTAYDLLEGSASSANAPMVVMGQPSDFDWDVCSVITYTNEIHFRQFMAVLADAENAKVLAEDEEKFMDRSKFKAVILGDTRKTMNTSWTEDGKV